MNERAKAFALFFLLFYSSEASVAVPPDPANGNVFCIDFGWDKICQVNCEKGFQPEREHAPYYEYNAVTKEWDSRGKEFPWSDCVHV